MLESGKDSYLTRILLQPPTTWCAVTMRDDASRTNPFPARCFPSGQPPAITYTSARRALVRTSKFGPFWADAADPSIRAAIVTHPLDACIPILEVMGGRRCK